MNLMSESEKSWLAGFIDGEGYVGLTFQRKKETKWAAPSVRYHPYLIITSTNKDVLVFIENLISEGNIYLLKRKSKQKEAWQFKITKMDTLFNILTVVLPYLKIKQRQSELLIEYIKKRKNLKFVTGRNHRGATSFTKDEEDLYKKLLILNKCGL